MKTLLLLLLLPLAGCMSDFYVEKLLPDGTIIRAKYGRWGNQQVKLKIALSDGTVIEVDQKSDTQLAFEAGVASVSVGGSSSGDCK